MRKDSSNVLITFSLIAAVLAGGIFTYKQNNDSNSKPVQSSKNYSIISPVSPTTPSISKNQNPAPVINVRPSRSSRAS